jgi:hypothetical protein
VCPPTHVAVPDSVVSGFTEWTFAGGRPLAVAFELNARLQTRTSKSRRLRSSVTSPAAMSGSLCATELSGYCRVPGQNGGGVPLRRPANLLAPRSGVTRCAFIGQPAKS